MYQHSTLSSNLVFAIMRKCAIFESIACDIVPLSDVDFAVW